MERNLNTTFSLDWLHVNEPFRAYALMGSFVYDIPTHRRLSPQTPRFGYTEGVINQAGAVVMRNVNRVDMGVHVGYSGKTLNTYREAGISSLEIVRWHIARGATFSRIDLAYDLRDTDMRPETLYIDLNLGLAVTTAKTFNLITGNDGGSTLYIGSRQSEAFVRIYDKGVESGTRERWIRVELELKSSKAQFAAYTMANEPDDSAYKWGQSWLAAFVNFQDETWQALMAAEAIPLASANKPEKDTRKWLTETVAPSIARYVNRTGDTKVLLDITTIVNALLDTSD